MKTMTLKQFLTATEIKKAIKLKHAKEICKQITQPNIERINESLGQENDPMYLAFAVEYALTARESV